MRFIIHDVCTNITHVTLKNIDHYWLVFVNPKIKTRLDLQSSLNPICTWKVGSIGGRRRSFCSGRLTSPTSLDTVTREDRIGKVTSNRFPIGTIREEPRDLSHSRTTVPTPGRLNTTRRTDEIPDRPVNVPLVWEVYTRPCGVPTTYSRQDIVRGWPYWVLWRTTVTWSNLIPFLNQGLISLPRSRSSVVPTVTICSFLTPFWILSAEGSHCRDRSTTKNFGCQRRVSRTEP